MEEPNTASWDDILRLASINPSFALAMGGGIGIIIALYLIGRIEEGREKQHKVTPTFENVDEEIAYHEKRLGYLKQLKDAEKPVEELLSELKDMVARLQTEVQELKGVQT